METANIPTLFSANKVAILDNIPISEKSSWPSILKAFHPSSRSVVLLGTCSVLHTTDNSSSVLLIKQKSSE